MEAQPAGGHLDLLQLDALRAGEGDAAARAHLEACEACRAALADLERIAAAVGRRAAPPGIVPEEVDRRVLAMAREALGRPPVERIAPTRRRWLSRAAGLAAAA